MPSLVNDRAGNKVHQKNMNHLTVFGEKIGFHACAPLYPVVTCYPSNGS